jgi:hypothetical protein
MIEEEQIKFYFFEGQSKNLWLSVPFCKAELCSRAKDILSTQRHFKRRQLSFYGRLRNQFFAVIIEIICKETITDPYVVC